MNRGPRKFSSRVWRCLAVQEADRPDYCLSLGLQAPKSQFKQAGSCRELTPDQVFMFPFQAFHNSSSISSPCLSSSPASTKAPKPQTWSGHCQSGIQVNIQLHQSWNISEEHFNRVLPVTRIKIPSWLPEVFDLKPGISTQLSFTKAFERGCFVFCSHKRYSETSKTSRTCHGVGWLPFIQDCSNPSQERGSGSRCLHVTHAGHSRKSGWKRDAGAPCFPYKMATK